MVESLPWRERISNDFDPQRRMSARYIVLSGSWTAAEKEAVERTKEWRARFDAPTKRRLAEETADLLGYGPKFRPVVFGKSLLDAPLRRDVLFMHKRDYDDLFLWGRDA